MNRGNIRAEERLYELKALQDAKKANDYLTLARTLSGYGDVVFPHCACDSRKDGHVIPAIGKIINYLLFFCRSCFSCGAHFTGMINFRLHACREDGALEAQSVELTWDSITQWESDDEAMAFNFQYSRPDKSPRWIKVFTPYVR